MNIKSIFKILLHYLIYLFAFLIIRKKDRYTFGGPMGTFKDNAKYLFIYASEHTDKDVAWVTYSKGLVKQLTSLGLKAYHVRSFRGIWHVLTSKYWFYNSYTTDIDFSLSGGATTVNLWHGVGIKCIERNRKNEQREDLYANSSFGYRIRHPYHYVRPKYVLSSNAFQNKFFSTSFRVPVSRCLEMGYPRNWILKTNEDERINFIRKYEFESTIQLVEQLKRPVSEGGYSKVLIYMPTWRDSQRDLFTQSMDLTHLNEVLLENNELLILKPHPMTLVDEADAEYSNIIFLDRMIDVYSILPYVQVLVTDYSSIIYDYLIIPPGTNKKEGSHAGDTYDRSVILYIYDYDDYVKNSREFFYPFDENVVGKRVYNFEELLKVIAEGDYALPMKDRQYLVDRFWGESQKYDSSRKILDYFGERK